MAKLATKEEETGKPSEEKAEEKVGKSSDFEAIGREIRRFEEEAEEKPSGKPETKPEEGLEKEAEKEGETPEEELESEEEPAKEEIPEAKLWVVGKDGKKIPLIPKARGKHYAPDKSETVLTWLSMGIESGERNKLLKEKEDDLKKKEQALGQYETFLQALDKADKEGKLYVEDETGKKIRVSSLGGKKEEEEEEEEDVLIDPEVKKLRKELKDLRKEVDQGKAERVKGAVEAAKDKIEKEIEQYRKANAAIFNKENEDSPKDIWEILEENPKMSVEEASKLSHESTVSFIKKQIEKNPDLFVDRKAIYADVLSEKKKEEEAPVEAPSGIPAGISAQGEKKDRFKGMALSDILREGFKDIEESHKSAEKS